jgi:hypothetical protein
MYQKYYEDTASTSSKTYFEKIWKFWLKFDPLFW